MNQQVNMVINYVVSLRARRRKDLGDEHALLQEWRPADQKTNHGDPDDPDDQTCYMQQHMALKDITAAPNPEPTDETQACGQGSASSSALDDMVREQQEVENYEARLADLELQRDLAAAESYVCDQQAAEEQARDDETLDAAGSYSWRPGQTRTRIRLHATLAGQNRTVDVDTPGAQGATITTQVLQVQEPGEWLFQGHPIPWWKVPVEVRGEDNGGRDAAGVKKPRRTYAQARSLRGCAVFDMNDPLVFGYYKMWMEGRLAADEVVYAGGRALLEFFEGVTARSTDPLYDSGGDTSRPPPPPGTLPEMNTVAVATVATEAEQPDPVQTEDGGWMVSTTQAEQICREGAETASLPGLDDVDTPSYPSLRHTAAASRFWVGQGSLDTSLLMSYLPYTSRGLAKQLGFLQISAECSSPMGIPQ